MTGPSAGATLALAGASEEALPSILFVDDEEGVLAGLRTSLRRLRREYRFHFALGAREALLVLASEPVDVVITDMRMPGMNGVDLLRQVKEAHPGIVRYVLSGEAERELVMQAIPVTHRWLTKPCSHEVLVEAVAGAVRHRGLLKVPEILTVIGGVDSLPSLPPLYRQLVTMLEDSDATIDSLAEVIAGDPAVSAKLLQWANSAFAGTSRVADLRTAVVRLGLNMVSYLVLCAEMTYLLDGSNAVPGIANNDLRRHVRSLSMLASGLAVPDDSLVAGAAAGLAEIGLLLEASHLPDRLHAAYERAEADDCTLVEAELGLYGSAHPELGGHLLSVWGLPSQLVLAVEGSYRLPLPNPAPLPADEAVRAARLAVQRLPYHASFGAPHRDRVEPELEAATELWLGALAAPASD